MSKRFSVVDARGERQIKAIDGDDPAAIRPAPSLGADTDAVLGELGLTAAQIAALRDIKAI